MHPYLELMAGHISANLKKRSITTCSKWAENFRILGGKDYPGPWTFKNHPWLRDMHDSNCRLNIGQKSAQMGYTETVLNKTFFKIDMHRTDCLYVLPAQTPDAHDFSSARFNPALELSPYLASMFSDVNNVGHKRAGSTNLYIRGSRSRAGLKSVSVGFLVLDELNEMIPENVSLSLERQSGQLTKECWMISTPTSDGFGINEHFQASTQDHFFFKCPSCSKFTELTFDNENDPECIVVTADHRDDPNLKNSYYRCKECKNKLIHQLKPQWLEGSQWIPSFANYDDRGFYINQMYSPTITPFEFADAFLKSKNNLADEQEFWNSKLGKAHTPEGSKINDKHLNESISGFLSYGGDNPDPIPRGIITLGVDQGKWIHYEVDLWTLPDFATTDINSESNVKVLAFGKCKDFEELDRIMDEFGVHACVIDAQPERRAAFALAMRKYGRVKLCFYGQGVQGKQIHVHSDEEQTITVDRTSWLDLSLSRYRTHKIQLPRDISQEYRMHLKSLVRIVKNDLRGNPVATYETKTNDHDHYAHARNYAEIALHFAVGIGENTDIIDY